MQNSCTHSSSCVASPAGRLIALAAMQETKSSPDDRAQEFRPVEGGGNVASGEVLLIEAYSVFWLMAMALLVGSWRKQKRLDERISGLRNDLERARKDDDDAPKLAKAR